MCVGNFQLNSSYQIGVRFIFVYQKSLKRIYMGTKLPLEFVFEFIFLVYKRAFDPINFILRMRIFLDKNTSYVFWWKTIYPAMYLHENLSILLNILVKIYLSRHLSLWKSLYRHIYIAMYLFIYFFHSISYIYEHHRLMDSTGDKI